jgi:hypothetical protein
MVSRDDRDWEYQSGSNEKVIVAGKFLGFHTTRLQDCHLELCPPFFAKNNASSLRNYDFVVDAIDDLLNKKCITQTDRIPHCCNPLTVAESPKLRLVLDLRHVNTYLEAYNFKYENLDTVRKVFEEGYYFCSFDLNRGYHHISVNPHHF